MSKRFFPPHHRTLPYPGREEFEHPNTLPPPARQVTTQFRTAYVARHEEEAYELGVVEGQRAVCDKDVTDSFVMRPDYAREEVRAMRKLVSEHKARVNKHRAAAAAAAGEDGGGSVGRHRSSR